MRRDRVFRGLAVLYAGGALFHLAAVVAPGLEIPGSRSRHLLFVVIDLGATAALWRRPRGVVVAFAALTVQQLYSHGGRVLRWWHFEHRIDWLSLAVLAVLVATLVLLLSDARARAGRPAAE
jgi:hypothetical protein